MAKVLIDGRVAEIYEKMPDIADIDVRAITLEYRRKEKHSREQDWKQRQRKGYRKK